MMTYFLLMLFPLSIWDQVCNLDLFWDNYIDVTPGIKVIEEIDRNLQGSKTIYNEHGMKVMKLSWTKQITASGDTINHKHMTTYVYDTSGRLIIMSKSDDPILVIIKYGNHAKYVPFDLLTGPGKGEISSIVGSRLIKNISEITLEYKDGSIYRHNFISDGNRLIHKYADLKENGRELIEQQNIECNEIGLPIYISLENGHIGPISYQHDGWFDSLPLIKDSVGSLNNGLNTVWTYRKDGTHLLDNIRIVISGITTKKQSIYNEKGLIISETLSSESLLNNQIIQKYYEYEYDSHGNWNKRHNVELFNSDSTVTNTIIRNIQYY